MSLQSRLDALRQDLPLTARLLAVTKTVDVPVIQQALDAGQRHFGENYAQDLRDKAAALPSATWHFIGRLQRNKAKYVARSASWVHALDHLEQVEALHALRSGPPLQALVAVNLAQEASKGGISPTDVMSFVESAKAYGQVQIVGLFTMPPLADDPQANAHFYAALADLAAAGRRAGHPLTELSMGTSADAMVAAAHGATWVRVGTALFGARGGPPDPVAAART